MNELPSVYSFPLDGGGSILVSLQGHPSLIDNDELYLDTETGTVSKDPMHGQLIGRESCRAATDKIGFFECECHSDEHVMRWFLLNDEWPEVYATFFLDPERNVFERIWKAVRYVFGYKSKYGHFDEFYLRLGDADRLIGMLEEYKRLAPKNMWDRCHVEQF